MNKCDVRGTRLRRTDEQRRTASTTCLPIDAEDPAASGWSSEFVCVCFSPWNAASNCRGESIYSVLDFLTSSAFVGTNPTGEPITCGLPVTLGGTETGPPR